MSWNLTLSGHVEGDDAAEKEAAILAAAIEIAASSGGTGSFSGQHTGWTGLPVAEPQTETLTGDETGEPGEATTADAGEGNTPATD